MDMQEMKKLKMHLQGAMDCLAKYEMPAKDDSVAETDDDEPSAEDSTEPKGSSAGLSAMKMKLLSYKKKA